MQKEGIIINGIYQHYKGDYYKIVDVAYHHEDGKGLAIVIYYKCDENGIFKSIRELDLDFSSNSNGEKIISQPFWRLLDEFNDIVKIIGNTTYLGNNGEQYVSLDKPRFKFIK